MAKKAPPSEVAETPLPTQEPPPSEAADVTPPAPEVEPKPEEGAPAPPAQEAEKPDVRAQLSELPDDERDAIYEEVYGDRLKRTEQSAQDSAWQRLQNAQQRQLQTNQGLQETIRNLEGAEDDNKRAGHVQGYADWYVQGAQQEWSQQALDNLRGGLGVSREEHDEIMLRLHQKAARENRVATFSDYVSHVTGERFMPKREVSKDIQEEVRAQLAEAQGQKIENQETPVSVGQGEPGPSGLTPEKKRTLSDEEHAKLSPEEIDAMTKGYLSGGT